MTEMIAAAGIGAVELLIFYVLGFYLPFDKTPGHTSIAENLCGGFLILGAFFEVTAVVCTWLEVRMTTFCYIWGGILSALVAGALVLHLPSWLERIRYWFKNLKVKPYFVLLLLGVGGLTGLAVLFFDAKGSPAGARMATDLFTDSLGKYDLLSGAERTSIPIPELLNRGPVYGAFLSMLTGLRPAAIQQVTDSLVVAVLFSMILYRIGFYLLDQKVGRAVLFALCALAAVFFTASAERGAGLFFADASSPLAVLGLIFLPALMLISLCLMKGGADRSLYLAAFFLGLAGLGMGGEYWWVLPAALPAFLLPASLAGKRWRGIFVSILCDLVPAAAVAVTVLVPALPFTS